MYKFLANGKQYLSALVMLTVFSATAVQANEDVVLTLLDATTGVVVELSEADLLLLEQTVVITENEFVDGEAEFSGPLARDVIALLGNPEIVTVRLVAANEYAVEVPVSDFIEYDVIFALFQDEQRFSSRDKGPMWVIYPMSDHEELQDRVYNDRLIWQMVRVDAL